MSNQILHGKSWRPLFGGGAKISVVRINESYYRNSGENSGPISHQIGPSSAWASFFAGAFLSMFDFA